VRHLSLTLLSLSLPLTLFAVDEPTPIIVVTADRTETDPWRTTATTAVIPAAEIHLTGSPDNWTDSLSTVPGVDIQNSAGGLDGGGLPTLLVRGAAANADTAVLVDGIPWADATSIGTDPIIHNLELPGIEHIEVVGGPQSGLYGSRALGGVIQVRTAEPTATPEGFVRVRAGSFSTRSIAGQATGPLAVADGRMVWGYAISASAIESDGISSTVTGKNGDPTDGEADALWRTGVNSRLVFSPVAGIRLHAGGWLGGSRHEYDSTGPDDADSFSKARTWRALAGGSVALPGDGEIVVDAARTRTHRDNHNPFSDGTFTGTTDFVAARVLTPVTDLLRVQVGADLDQQAAVYDPIGDRGQSTVGVWGQALLTGQQWEATGVLRLDDFSIGEDPWSWKIGGAWFPGAEQWRLHASLGTSYRAPSLDERFADYVDPFFAFFANPDLKVQSGLGWDAGVTWRSGSGLESDLTAFGTHYDQRIVSVFASDFSSGTLVNESSSARTVGVESATTWKSTAPYWGRLALTWQDSQDEDGDPFRLVPEWKGAVVLGWKTEAWFVTATTTLLGSRLAANDEKLEPTTTVDVATGYLPRPWLELTLRVDNVFDERYVTNSTFTPGEYYSGTPRQFSIGVEARY